MIKLCYVIVGLILVIAGNSFFVKKKSNIVSENDTELQKVTETSEILGLYASHKYKEALETNLIALCQFCGGNNLYQIRYNNVRLSRYG